MNLPNPEANTNAHSKEIQILNILQLKNNLEQTNPKDRLLAKSNSILAPNAHLIDNSINSLDVNEEGHVNLDFQESKNKNFLTTLKNNNTQTSDNKCITAINACEATPLKKTANNNSNNKTEACLIEKSKPLFFKAFIASCEL